MNDTLANFDEIDDMLDGDPEAQVEFYEAAITSFSDFCNDFKTCMSDRDLEDLRKVGHRIRPAAQMLGVTEINEKYEEAKQLLKNEETDQQVTDVIEEVDYLCNTIIDDFKEKIDTIK